MVYLDQILQTYLFENCPATHPLCIHNSDEALRSIISADKGHLVKMLITLKPHVIFWSNLAYLYILTLSGLCTGMQNANKA